jgi:predicted metal-dependent enzyme (double-stranded beta helix superfamily)
MEGGTWMFEVQEFIASCQAALKEHSPELAVKELMEQIMSRPSEVEAALGTPTQGGITTLLRSDELTVLNIIWPPGMALYPHNHNLWAVIGLYGGQEDNTFFRRNTRGTGLIRAGFKELQAQDAIVLGKEAIHAVTNPRSVFTGAIHVYGGDFFAQPRSEWDSEQSEERPYSVERAMQAFAEANEKWLVQEGKSS